MSSIVETHGSGRDESSGHRNYVLLVLLVVAICCWIDRQVFSMLMQSLKQEFHFSDTQLGLLGGLAFGVFYAAVGLPIAWCADRFSRLNIITIALSVWSVMTVVCGFATGFASLFLARVGVGVGEAGGSPPSQSIISDYFPPERRAFALGVFFSFVPLGSLFGLFASGWLNEYLGWRMAFIVVGAPGILLAIVLKLTVREPRRGQSEPYIVPAPAPAPLDALRYLLSRPSVRHLCAAGCLHGVGAFGAAVWLPAYFMRVQGLGSGQAGSWLALIVGGAGLIGTLAGGYLADRVVSKRGDQSWYPRLAAIFVLATLPFLAGVYLAPSVNLALMLFVLPSIFQNMFLGAVTASMQNLAGVRRRATIAALYGFLVNLIAMGLGPTIVGMVSDALLPAYGNDSLRYALVGVVVVSGVWAALHFALASRHVTADLALAECGDVRGPGPAVAVPAPSH